MTRGPRAIAAGLTLLLTVGSWVTLEPEAARAVAQLPTPRPMILGGESQTAAKAPWIVQIVTIDTKSPVVRGKKYSYYTCSGTVISPTWVLTAAHCVFDDSTQIARYPSGSIRVYAPGVAGSPKNFFSKGRRATKVFVHPLYQKTNGSFSADLALIKLAAPIPGSKSMALDSGLTDLSVGARLSAYGWGVTDRAGEIDAKTINMANLTMAGTPTDTACGVWALQNGQWSPSFLCATADAESAVCAGDSGGPFVKFSVTGKPVLVGVATWGPDEICGTTEAPTAAVRIAPMRWWIDAVIKKPTSTVVSTAGGSWAFVSDNFGFSNGAIEQRSTGNIFALGWPEPEQSILNVVRLNGASGVRIAASSRTGSSGVLWQDQQNNNWVNDAIVLNDGRIAWGEVYEGYSADFPTILVAATSNSASSRDWAGSSLAQKVLGDTWDSGWHWAYPRLTPLASGGLAASWELYNDGEGVDDTVIAVFKGDGSLDTRFAGVGWTRLNLPGGAAGLALIQEMGAGEYVIAGSLGTACAAAKVGADGLLANNWGAAGIFTFTVPEGAGGSGECYVADVESDGSGGVYLVGSDGYQDGGTGSIAYLTRLGVFGATEPSFGNNGWWTVDSSANDELLGVCRAKNGKIVVAGLTSASSLFGYGTDRIGATAMVSVLTPAGVPAPQMAGRAIQEFSLGGERDRFVAVSCLSRGGAVLVGRTTVAADSVDDAELHSIYIKINVR